MIKETACTMRNGVSAEFLRSKGKGPKYATLAQTSWAGGKWKSVHAEGSLPWMSLIWWKAETFEKWGVLSISPRVVLWPQRRQSWSWGQHAQANLNPSVSSYFTFLQFAALGNLKSFCLDTCLQIYCSFVTMPLSPSSNHLFGVTHHWVLPHKCAMHGSINCFSLVNLSPESLIPRTPAREPKSVEGKSFSFLNISIINFVRIYHS